MPATVTRRKLLGAGVAAGAGVALASVGVRPARALDLWMLDAGGSGSLTQGWHGDLLFGSSGAIDIGAAANAAVGLYARKHQSSYYGWRWCSDIVPSCESVVPANAGQKAMRFFIGRSSDPTTSFGQCAYIHVYPTGVVKGQSGQAYGQIATVGAGIEEVNGLSCYTGPHLHQTANGSHNFDPAYSPASAGNTSYWYWYA